MSPLDEFEILVNPGTEYYKKNLGDISRTEGWSFCETDYDTWLRTFSKLWYLMAVKRGTDEPLASVSLALDEYSENGGEPLYSIGMFYCRPEYRGIGLGKMVWDTMMKIPPKDTNITLNGAMTMAPKYAEHYGFIHMPFKLNFANFECKDLIKVELPKGIITKDASAVPFSHLEAYDSQLNPRPHPKFLKRWMFNEGTYSRIAYDSDGNTVGFCCIREDVGGNLSAGPLYAENKDVALTLVSETLATIDLTKFEKFIMLYPDTNKESEKILSELSCGKHFSITVCCSQFTKKIYPVPQQKIFSVADSSSGFM